MAPWMSNELRKIAYGSDLVVELLRAVGIEHVALNPGATFRGLHDSLVNYPGAPELVLTTHEEIAVALAHGYARGTVFAIANPEAAIRILWEVYPQTRATGKDEATALKDDLTTLEARAKNWRFEPVDGKRWGDNVERNYQAYLDWLMAQGVVKTKVEVKDLITNELLDEVNKFDAQAIASQAKAYKMK